MDTAVNMYTMDLIAQGRDCRNDSSIGNIQSRLLLLSSRPANDPYSWTQHIHAYTTHSGAHSVVWVRDGTIPTERPQLVGEISANFCWYRVPLGQRHGSLRPYSRLSRPEPLLFLPQLLSCTHEAEWTPFQSHYFSENLVAQVIELGSLAHSLKNIEKSCKWD
jgi:hypothetical protein